MYNEENEIQEKSAAEEVMELAGITAEEFEADWSAIGAEESSQTQFDEQSEMAEGPIPFIREESEIVTRMAKMVFRLNNEGLFRECLDKKEQSKELLLVSSPIKIVADNRDINSEKWGRVLEFPDSDGVLHRFVLQMEDFAKDGREILGKLYRHGLQIYPSGDARAMLLLYLKDAMPLCPSRLRLTEKTGWHGNKYVLPDRSIGTDGEEYIFESATTLIQTYSQRGTFAGWKRDVAALCSGNSRLTFAVSAAMASALIGLTNDENGGVHFFGSSSTGKTHTLYVAASVCGKPTVKDPNSYIHSWRGTDNGHEGNAKLHNDSPLILDEMGEAPAKNIGEIAYMFANGVGKQRANTSGDARRKSNWRCLFLSTGEITLAQHMAEIGKTTRAGMEIRLLDIPADAGAGYGVYENLHGYPCGRTFSEALRARTFENYGTAFPVFIETVISNRSTLLADITRLRAEFLKEFMPADAKSQVQRAITRFALIAAAGEYATSHGLTGWTPGEAMAAAGKCFNAWLEHREAGAGMQETAAILSQVRLYFENHGESRFSLWSLDNEFLPRETNHSKTLNRAGFRKLAGPLFEYYVLTESFNKDICKGFNPREVAKLLAEKGVLYTGSEGRPSKTVALPGMGPTRCYHFRSSVFGILDQQENSG